jgi:hypothetical protein
MLLPGPLCPLFPAFLAGLRRWIPDHRRAPLHNRQNFVSVIVLRRCLPTLVGENVLGMMLVLWKTFATG